MISIRLEGGMANQLTQSAWVLSYSKKYGLDYCIEPKVHTPHIGTQGFYRFPGINYCDSPPDLMHTYKEQQFPYYEIQRLDNTLFTGYFQSYRYWDAYRAEVLKAFGFGWELKRGYCAIHWRRGDYLQFPDHHPVVSDEYMLLAMALMYAKVGGKVIFKFYSDDLPYCRDFVARTHWFSKLNIEFSEGKDERSDMQDASCCENFCGSNSMFSFWIYYLNQNPNKVGIFPSNQRWFGKALNHDTSTLLPPECIRL